LDTICAAHEEDRPGVKIAICVKEVPDPSAPRRIDADTGRLVRTGETTLNPYDRHAIEAGVRLREGPAAGAEITIVTMAPATATRTVDRALAQGGDRSVHLADDALAGSDVVATSYALAELLRRDAYDLVLFGQSAADSECYVLAAAVAERLERPCVTQVAALELDGGTLRVKRQVETGYDTIELPLPAVLSVSDAINEPRYPALPAIMGAKRKPHERLTAAEAGLDPSRIGAAGARTRVQGLLQPPARGEGLKIEDAGDAAERILAFLVERRLVA
jgi:electron transfer flavoprotein beta subunit